MTIFTVASVEAVAFNCPALSVGRWYMASTFLTIYGLR